MLNDEILPILTQAGLLAAACVLFDPLSIRARPDKRQKTGPAT
jgi:hypothetical protein